MNLANFARNCNWKLALRTNEWVAVKHALDVDELECPVRREQVAVLHAVDVQRARLGREGDAHHLDRLGPLIADL